jgi:hypothetical protein
MHSKEIKLNSEKLEGSASPVKQDQDAGKKRKIKQHVQKAMDVKTPPTQTTAKASGFSFRPTSAAQSDDESEADEDEGKTHSTTRTNFVLVRRNANPQVNSEETALAAIKVDAPE